MIRLWILITKLLCIKAQADRKVGLNISNFGVSTYSTYKYEFYLNHTDQLTCTATGFSNIQSIKLEIIGDGNFSIARAMCSDTSSNSSDTSWEVEAVEASGVKLSLNNECNEVATRQQLSLLTQMTLTDVSYTGRIICTAEDDGGVTISSNHTDISEVRVPPPDDLTLATIPETIKEGEPFLVLCGPDEPGAVYQILVEPIERPSERIFFFSEHNQTYTPTERDRSGLFIGCTALHRRQEHPNWFKRGISAGKPVLPIRPTSPPLPSPPPPPVSPPLPSPPPPVSPPPVSPPPVSPAPVSPPPVSPTTSVPPTSVVPPASPPPVLPTTVSPPVLTPFLPSVPNSPPSTPPLSSTQETITPSTTQTTQPPLSVSPSSESDSVETTPKALKQILEELESEKSYMLNCKVYLTEGSEWSEYIWYRGGVLEETKTHLLNVSFEGGSGEETEKITCVPVSTEGLVDNDKRIEWEITWTGNLFELKELGLPSSSLHVQTHNGLYLSAYLWSMLFS